MEQYLLLVREKVLNKSLIVSHIPFLDQLADIFTKALSSTQFTSLRDKLSVVDKFSTILPP